jgi:hypothetical protein
VIHNKQVKNKFLFGQKMFAFKIFDIKILKINKFGTAKTTNMYLMAEFPPNMATIVYLKDLFIDLTALN